MEWTPKDMAELLKVLSDWSDATAVESEADTGIAAKTVKDLRDLPFWRGGLVIVTPEEGYPEQAIKIRKTD